MPTIAIDFDGVIAKYTGWKGHLTTGKPLKNVAKYLDKLRWDGWTVIIHTCRSDGDEIKKYCEEYSIFFDYLNWNPANNIQGLNQNKPVADVYLDDKGITFEGEWNDELFKKIIHFKPYWKRRNIKQL